MRVSNNVSTQNTVATLHTRSILYQRNKEGFLSEDISKQKK